jgi:DNA-binding response OmpR family regulator
MVAGILKRSAYEVVSANDATEALAQAEQIELGLIILDLNLNGESGQVLMKFLKRNHPEVPILIYTALDHQEDEIQTLLQHGASQYLRKGSSEELVKAVKRSFR